MTNTTDTDDDHEQNFLEDIEASNGFRSLSDYDSSWKDEIKRKEIPGQNVSFPHGRKYQIPGKRKE